MDLETFWYEAFPYVCGAGGLLALWFGGSSLLCKGSGALLIAASLTIIHLRRSHRRERMRRIASATDVARGVVPDH